MPNTDPINDNPAVTVSLIEQAMRLNSQTFFQSAQLRKEVAAKNSRSELKNVVSSQSRRWPSCSVSLNDATRDGDARGFDLTVVDHCQDPSLSAGGVMHEGRWSLILGLRGMPAAAEDVDVVRDCVLAKLTGAKVHIAHVSTIGALDAVRTAKRNGLSVTCEVTPHHWTLTDEAVSDYDTNTKMSRHCES
jgi:dihydroorotase